MMHVSKMQRLFSFLDIYAQYNPWLSGFDDALFHCFSSLHVVLPPVYYIQGILKEGQSILCVVKHPDWSALLFVPYIHII